MGKMDIYKALATTPSEAKKTIKGGRLNGFTDINPMWRIKALTEQFGPCGLGWYIDIVETKLEEHGEEVKAFAKVNLYWRQNASDPWSAPVTGLGGSSFVSKERSGAYVSDECFKMAVTDAIGSACKLLGMSADIFYQSDRTKYTATTEDAPEPVIISREKPDVVPVSSQTYTELVTITTPEEREALEGRYGKLLNLDEQSILTLIKKIRDKKAKEIKEETT